ncbi:hypothetical protein UlMin_003192 [Ulmus minor]
MSFSDHRLPFMPSLNPYDVGSDAISILPQCSMNNDDHNSDFDQHHPPFKRARNSEESQSNPLPYPPMNTRMIPAYAPINKGNTNIFFKTRLCAKFKVGACRNGENCNFAHGIEDMRQPPPNWQELVGLRDEDRTTSANWDDDQKIIHRMKLCKKYYNGEECPYGDRCNFLHEDPSKFRDDGGRIRESSAISIGITGQQVVHGSGSSHSDDNRPLSTNSDASRAMVKPVYWKTKLCNKWEQTGHCPFGEKCHFAHGQAELQLNSVRVEAETLSSGSFQTKQPQFAANDPSPIAATSLATFKEEGQGKKCLLKWKGPKKINRIYADWLDDVPLVLNFPSQVES